MSVERQIERNKLKIKQGNNKIRKAWRIHQVDKYGIEPYCEMYNQNNSHIKKIHGKKYKICRDKLVPKQVYNV